MLENLSDAELRKLQKKLESGLYHAIDFYGSTQKEMTRDFATLLWELQAEIYGRFKLNG